ncbi:MAG: SRPBCC family protein [Acidimicrobiia bacterium]|nr:SRPBCC family protein [Acidimicrobiia bacterium]
MNSSPAYPAATELNHRAVVVATVIDRSPAEVWADVRDISSHVEWMQDAVAIRFLSDHWEGPGTRFECDTKIGPFSLTDVMEITSWQGDRRMGVRHVGLVEGTGEFTLTELADGRTEFRWEEDLTFPWWMGGSFGAFVARPVLRSIWKQNLARLKERIER